MIVGPPVSPLAIPLLCMVLGHHDCLPPPGAAPPVLPTPIAVHARSAFDPPDLVAEESAFLPAQPAPPPASRLALAALAAAAFVVRRRLDNA